MKCGVTGEPGRIVAANLRGMFLVAQAVSRHMVERGAGGVIINMSSTDGLGWPASAAAVQKKV